MRSKLSAIWKINCLRLISLRKDYFHILLTSEEEKAKVWSMGALNLKPGILKLLPWVADFNPNKQKNTNVHVWVRFYYLSWAYWHPKTLSDVARDISVPLKIDQDNINGDFGHFARVLTDIDLNNPLLDTIQLERGEKCMFINLFMKIFQIFVPLAPLLDI